MICAGYHVLRGEGGASSISGESRQGPAGGGLILIPRPPRHLHPVSSSWSRNVPPKVVCSPGVQPTYDMRPLEALHQGGETISRAHKQNIPPRLSRLSTHQQQ